MRRFSLEELDKPNSLESAIIVNTTDELPHLLAFTCKSCEAFTSTAIDASKLDIDELNHLLCPICGALTPKEDAEINKF